MHRAGEISVLYYTISFSLMLSIESFPIMNLRRASHSTSSTPTMHITASTTSDQLNQYLSFPNPGDLLPDYSYAGFNASSTPIPNVQNVFITIQPKDDQSDRTEEIQAAINQASQVPGGAVVELASGDYWLSNDSPIRLPSSVVLRGDPTSNTILHTTGSPRNLIEFGDPKSTGTPTPSDGMSIISDPYVPLGATDAELNDATGFKVGQSVILNRNVTATWLKAMNMDDLFRNGKHENWLSVGTAVQQEREITSIDGNRISWTLPLTDPIDSKMSDDNSTVIAFTPPDRIRFTGIENLIFNQTPSASHLPVGTKTILPIMIGSAEDCWIKNVQSIGFIEFAYFTASSRRVTMEDFVIYKDAPTANGGKGALPLDITLGGSQALLLRGKTVGDQDTASYIVATARLAMGPNVISDYSALGSTRHAIEPHQRWSTGLLVERARVGQINLKNRGILGSGHGWTMGAGIIWSSIATKLMAEDPPTSKNFMVNSKTVEKLTEELNQDPSFDFNDPWTSLYQLQLKERVSDDVVKQILGY